MSDPIPRVSHSEPRRWGSHPATSPDYSYCPLTTPCCLSPLLPLSSAAPPLFSSAPSSPPRRVVTRNPGSRFVKQSSSHKVGSSIPARCGSHASRVTRGSNKFSLTPGLSSDTVSTFVMARSSTTVLLFLALRALSPRPLL